MLEPKINRRVNWEQTPENYIYRKTSTVTWTALARILCEIQSRNFSMDENDQPNKDGGIIIRSLNTDWDVVANAQIICEVIVPQISEMEIDEKSPESNKEAKESKEKVRKSFHLTSCFIVLVFVIQEGEARFPLRSRQAVSKSDEPKTWNIIQTIKSAFWKDDWEILAASCSHPKAGSAEKEASSSHSPSCQEISDFFKTSGADICTTPQTLAIALLKQRLQSPICLEVGSAVKSHELKIDL